MATVKFTAFIADVRGRLGDWVWSFNRGTHYKKAYNPKPTQPNTYRQLQCRGYFKDLINYWENLTDVQKSLWNGYGSMHNRILTAQTAYLMLNLNLLSASHADLGCIYTPPPFPATPKYPKGFCVYPISSTANCINWTDPLNTKDYITCYFRLHRMFCADFPDYGLCTTTGYRPYWHFVETVRSDIGLVVHTHDWPTGAYLYYKLASIDKYGRQSPRTHEVRITVPS